MDGNGSPASVRRIGTICIDKGLITAEQLASALALQEQTGEVLGEILVTNFGVTRLQLADVLAEQWSEINSQPARREENGNSEASGSDTSVEQVAEDELRVLLEEAQAVRADLTRKTEELGARLAALETLVVGVSQALAELRATNGAHATENGAEEAGNGAPAAKPRTRRRSTTRATTSTARSRSK